MSPVERIPRLARIALGLPFVALGFTLNYQSHLGLGPLFVVQQGLSIQTGISLGTATIATGLGLFLFSLVLRERPGVGTLATVFLGGVAVDVFVALIPDFGSMPVRVVALVSSLFVMTFGGSLIVGANLGVAPLDAVMIGIYRRVPLSLYQVRILMELTMLVVGFFLGGEVGIGCIYIGLGVGPALQLWLRVIGGMPAKFHEVVIATDTPREANDG